MSAAAGDKPIDLGTGELAASFGHGDPGLLSLTVFHARHGVVELTGGPRFDERQRGDPVATRAHRLRLASDESLCCWLEGPDGQRCEGVIPDPAEPEVPRWHGRLGSAGIAAQVRAVDVGWLELRWSLTGWFAPPPVVRFAGRVDVPALAEITETHPPTPVSAPTSLRAAGPTLTVVSEGIGAAARLHVERGTWEVTGHEAIARVEGNAHADGRLEVALRLSLAAGGGSPESRASRAGTQRKLPATAPGVEPLVARALAYVRGCTALRTSADERVILTDHRLLPLSWTRDAYYQALLLLATGARDDARLVAEHLRWLWLRCERPDGRWARSHHADGRAKDLGFQADQQLYPMLELCDYWRSSGGLPDGVDWTDAVGAAWEGTMTARDPATGLLATGENAADDPAAAPFIGAAQILLWYTARRLLELADSGIVGLDAAALAATADDVRDRFAGHFDGGGPWPYAVDGVGGRLAYHDANDLPLALAPIWGFCRADHAGWRATIDFAWSSANPGWYPGRRGGLGSVHTPQPWTLGDVQDWLVGRALGDSARRARALRRLREVAFADSMLPEAYSAEVEPDLRVRHWFAWPGASIGALLLLDERGELETRLGARAAAASAQHGGSGPA